MSSVDAVSEGKKQERVHEASATFFRSLALFTNVRVCVLFLLLLNWLWFVVLLFQLVMYSCVQIVVLGSSKTLRAKLKKTGLSIRRSLICSVCLKLGFFSPPLGIMVGCAYFLIYDKQGIEEVVPLSLRKQFTDIFSLCQDKEKDQSAQLSS